MELHFLGRGSAFNTKEGNTSAYFVDGDQLFLIDCGESVFAKILQLKLLDEVAAVNVFITHTHSDHVGSLGSLVAYCYFVEQITCRIVYGETYHRDEIIAVLETFGCDEYQYDLVEEITLAKKCHSTAFTAVDYVKIEHCPELASWAIMFDTPEGSVFYSGDTCDKDLISHIVNSWKVGLRAIDKFYVDTTSADYPGNVHLYVGTLAAIVPPELRSKVYCMHVNDDGCIAMAKQAGFNVVEVDS